MNPSIFFLSNSLTSLYLDPIFSYVLQKEKCKVNSLFSLYLDLIFFYVLQKEKCKMKCEDHCDNLVRPIGVPMMVECPIFISRYRGVMV